MVNKNVDSKNFEVIVQIAGLKDSLGIHNALKQNLIEIRDFDDITDEQRKELEERGFLRKEVDEDFYVQLIQDVNKKIYVAKNKRGDVIGFASIYNNENNIKTIRKTLQNLHIEDKEILDLLVNEKRSFAYLDQISIVPEFKRKGVGTAILEKALVEIDIPLVAFIVKLPLMNKASALWHEHTGFELVGTGDGDYKGQKFEWLIYIK
jgi:ribosomal protein S18 acetylase RimI-like enzyme